MADPAVTNYAQAWAKRLAAYKQAGVPDDSIRPVLKQDLATFKKGGAPLSDQDATAIVTNFAGKGDVTGVQKGPQAGWRKVLGNIVPDARAMLGGLFNPASYIRPVKSTYNLVAGDLTGDKNQVAKGLGFKNEAEYVDYAKQRGSQIGPDGKAENIFQDPLGNLRVFRDILAEGRTAGNFGPGVTTAARLFQGGKGFGEIEKHPLQTVLDVLPVAAKGGKMAAAAKAGELGADAEQVAAIGKFGREARTASTDVFGKDTPFEALGQGKPLRALSRITPGGIEASESFPFIRPREQSLSQRLGDFTERANIGKDAREQAFNVSIGREMNRHITAAKRRDILDEAKALGLDDEAKMKSVAADLQGVGDGSSTAAELDFGRQHSEALFNLDPEGLTKDAEGFVRGSTSQASPYDRAVLKAEGRIEPERQRIQKELGKVQEKKDKYIQKILNDPNFAARLDRHAKIRARQVTASSKQELASAFKVINDPAKYFEVLNKRVDKLKAQVPKAAEAAQKARDINPPASAMPALEVAAKENLLTHMADALTPGSDAHAYLFKVGGTEAVQHLQANFDNISEKVKNGLDVSNVDLPSKFVVRARNEILQNWKSNPNAVSAIFLPQLTPARARSLNQPFLAAEGVVAPGTRKGRLGAAAAENHLVNQILAGENEITKANTSKWFVENLQKTGKIMSKKDALDSIHAEVLEAVKANPTINAAAMEQILLDRRFEAFNPEAYGFRKGMISADNFIAKDTARAIRAMRMKDPNALMRLAQVSTGVFKTLALINPSFLEGNLFGNIGLMAIGGNPAMLRFSKEAAYMVREYRAGRIPNILTEETAAKLGLGHTAGGGMIDMPEGYKSAYGQQAANSLQRFYEESGYSPKQMRDKWFSINSFMDDTFKAMAYLYEHRRTQGNVEKAVSYANDVFVSMEKMTPFERNVVRQVIPFYTFQRHIAEMLAKYPSEHPVRLSIMRGISQMEQEEGDLPARFRSIWLLGSNGHTAKGFNTNLFNPYADFADNFTLAGFLRASNPFIRTGAERAGLDTFTGQPVQNAGHFDPETGKIVPNHPSAVKSILDNFIPQVTRVERAGGFTDPSGLKRLITSRTVEPEDILHPSGIGTRPVDIDKERYNEQKSILNAAGNAVSKAQTKGDVSELSLFDTVPFQGKMVPAAAVAAYITSLKRQNHDVAPKLLMPAKQSAPKRRATKAKKATASSGKIRTGRKLTSGK